MSEWAGRVGILIIGSLYWDNANHRRAWRRDRLDLGRRRYVRVPIRYGRFSTTRQSYTMVFSTSLAPEEYGRAIVVPCRRRVRSAADIVDEAVQLWTAETPTGKNRWRRVSAKYGWGCIGLLPSPQRPLPADLCSGWSQRISSDPCYRSLSAADGEDPAVNESGLLTIAWPESEDGSGLEVDLLLATATDPTIVSGRYPTPREIGDKCNRSERRAEYFRENRRVGIRTFQDANIEARLKSGKLGA